MKRETSIVLFLFAGWFCSALAIGVAGWFRAASAPMVAATVWGLTALILILSWKFQPVRNWATEIDVRWLVRLHATRFVGIYFLILCNRGQLPTAFAMPAGIGDILVAGSALILLALSGTHLWRPLLLGWNAFGLIDMILVIFAALRSGLTDWTSMAALRQLPLSLLPTFLVPLIIASHILIFVRVAARATVATGSG